MSEEKNMFTTVSFKLPTVKKEGYVSVDEFNALLEISGDKNKSQLIHKAILHYAEVISKQLENERTNIDDRRKRLNELFVIKP